MTFKVVINYCYGGFGLSPIALKRYAELKGYSYTEKEASCSILGETDVTIFDSEGNEIYDWDIPRDDLHLVRVVEELKEKANADGSLLVIIELPDDVKDEWEISQYDGMESIHEIHRTWNGYQGETK